MFRLTCQADAGEEDEEAAPSEVEGGDGAFMWRLKASTTKQNKYKQNEMK